MNNNTCGTAVVLGYPGSPPGRNMGGAFTSMASIIARPMTPMADSAFSKSRVLGEEVGRPWRGSRQAPRNRAGKGLSYVEIAW